MGFKYIVIASTRADVTRHLPIIFPDMLVHKDVFDTLVKTDSLKATQTSIVSAGECDIVCADASGRSNTLNVLSRCSEDELLINQFPYFHGIEGC